MLAVAEADLVAMGANATAKTHGHEIVSIYPFSDAETDQLMANSNECVLMWATKDGWPVGVTHSFVGVTARSGSRSPRTAIALRPFDATIEFLCASAAPSTHRMRRARWRAARSRSKRRAEIFDDEATKRWFYPALSKRLSPTNASGEEFFNDVLDSPLRVVLGVTPVKNIMYNAALAARHMAGTVGENELGARLESDRVRMNKEREARGLKPR
jgi:hypothetical protein